MTTIKDMKCPECGNTDSFNIEIGAIYCVDIDGVQEAPRGCDTDWGSENWCSCNECAFEGTVADFLQTVTQPGQPSPRPWICHSGMVWQDKPGVSTTGDGEGRLPIAQMHLEAGNRTDPEERDANAHHIVLAVNCHDDLLDMLKAVEARISIEQQEHMDDPAPATYCCGATHIELLALIAKAEGKP